MTNKFVVGLTGGIASGKSAASDHFLSLGIDVVDADVIARQVVAPNTPAYLQIVTRFGNEILNDDQSLNRGLLRDRVFSDPSHKDWINALLHPLIREQMITQTQSAQSPYVVLSVPLLVENKLQFLVDRLLVIDLDENTQINRAMQRDGSDEQVIRSIISAQATREQRRELADDIIVNDKDVANLVQQIDVLHKNYLTLSNKNM